MTIDDADDAHGHDQGVTKQELHPSPGPPTVPSHETPAWQDKDKLITNCKHQKRRNRKKALLPRMRPTVLAKLFRSLWVVAGILHGNH